jgi:hypothetical protein
VKADPGPGLLGRVEQLAQGEGSGFGHGKSQPPLPCFGMSKTESYVFMDFDGGGQRGIGQRPVLLLSVHRSKISKDL